MKQSKINQIINNATNNILNIETYPYLQVETKKKTVYEKLATVLYNGQETNGLVLTTQTAKKRLDADVGYEAENA